MPFRIAAVSDIHLQSNFPKAESNEACVNSEYGWRRNPRLADGLKKIVVPTYNRFMFANAVPGITIDNFQDLSRLAAKRINELNPNLVVINGDLFNVGRKVGKDTEIQPDAKEVFAAFTNQLNCPVFLLPGNSDVKSLDCMESTLSTLASLENNHLDPCNEYSFQYGESSNFTLETDSCTIIGLNSVGVAEFGQDESPNQDYLQGSLEESNGSPVIVFTHHPPFNVLSFIARKIFKYGRTKQEWITPTLCEHASRAKTTAAIISGHCHRWVKTRLERVTQHCLLPMFTRHSGSVYLGSVVEIDGKKIDISPVKL